ncbi:MAG TPA: hypothetical protein EYN91_00915 [Candidatus Melainabacteria bacterium]|jgi:hypothetical protein|nr:hypothetical protein [Candidatus Melainabacteria bacterium]HIN63481.1 hypothetical protein [Candidatus Obscuribacterales bacterium]
MSKNFISMSRMLTGSILVGTTICLLCSCSQKVSETSHTGDGYTQRTEVVREGDHLKTTTVTTEIDPVDSKDDVHITTSESDGIHVRLPEDETNDGRVRVRAPFVKMDSDDNSGSVHVRAPFLKVDKDGHGDRVRVRIPGIHINAD